MFFPPANPGRITEKINEAASLFTTGVSRETITNSMGRILRSQWIRNEDITLLMIACIVVMLGVAACCAGACMSLGNRKMKRRGLLLPVAGAPVMAAGLLLIRRAYDSMLAHGEEAGKLDTIKLMLPDGFTAYCVFAGLLFITALAALLMTRPVKDPEVRMEMDEKYRLFLMMLPVILLTFIFAYLPIWGWRFAFFDYKPGGSIGADNFVGLKWFGFALHRSGHRERSAARAAEHADHVRPGHPDLLAAHRLRRTAGGDPVHQIPADRADPDHYPQLHLLGAGLRHRDLYLLHGRLCQQLPDQCAAPDRCEHQLPADRGPHLAEDASVGHLEGRRLERDRLYRGHRRH